MIHLEQFNQSDFQQLKNWISNEEELLQFAGTIFKFPLTDKQLLQYIRTEDVIPYKIVLNSTNEIIGHCELNLEKGNRRLSRILIGDKHQRGKSIGEAVVRKMAEQLFTYPETSQVDLNVYDWNQSAIRCYQKVGFTINPNKSSETIVNGKIWKGLNMILKK